MRLIFFIFGLNWPRQASFVSVLDSVKERFAFFKKGKNFSLFFLLLLLLLPLSLPTNEIVKKKSRKIAAIEIHVTRYGGHV